MLYEHTKQKAVSVDTALVVTPTGFKPVTF